MRLSRPVSLLAALACVPLYAATSDNEQQTPVMVKDIAVVPMANLAYADDSLVLHPKALAGLGYNTNVFAASTNEQKDAYYRALAGLLAKYRLDDQDKLVFDGELETARYFKSSNKQADLTGGRATLDYHRLDQNDDLELHTGYQRYNDPLIQTGQQILRQNYDAGAFGTWRGSEFKTVAGVTAVRTDYLEDGIGFTKDSRDNDDYALSLRFGYSHSREGFSYVLARVERIKYDENTQFNNSNGYTIGLGEQSLLGGERATLLLEAGVTFRRYDHDFANNPAFNDQNVTEPYVNAYFKWPWEEGSHIGVNLFSRIEDSLTSNAAWIYGGKVDGRLRLKQNVHLFASVEVYRYKDQGHAAGVQAEERTTEDLQAGIELGLRRGMVLRFLADYTNSSSSTSNDFKRFTGAADVAVAF